MAGVITGHHRGVVGNRRANQAVRIVGLVIVDDEPDIRELLGMTLAAMDIATVAAADSEAWEPAIMEPVNEPIKRRRRTV